MDIHKLRQMNATPYIDYWDSLSPDIFAGQKPSHTEMLEYIEKSCMFSLFARTISSREIILFKSLFHIKNTGYVIVLDLYTGDRADPAERDTDEQDIYRVIKDFLSGHPHSAVGPLITNRICILISGDDLDKQEGTPAPEQSKALTQRLIEYTWKECGIPVSAGVGSIYNINSIFSSFREALSCMHHCSPGQAVHYYDLASSLKEGYYLYNEAEKHMLEAIRLHKEDAYDYFSMMMDYLRPMSITAKRNKIFEILVLVAHSIGNYDNNEGDHFNYAASMDDILEYDDDQLIQWAYSRFMYMTGYDKQHNSIDYSNRIVQATREYLEAHYAEEITLNNVAEQVNISPQYFSKLIKKSTGFNFIDWLSMLRVKKAKELLSSSNYTIKEVCFMVGYKDPNYFSRIFKKRQGMTPSEYLKSRGINTK
jgi:two-component system response regulator YesN